MSNLREAAQLAVEVLRQWVIPRAGVGTVHYKKALELLRAALAQPDDKAQPVARIPFAGYDPKFCPGSNPDNPQPPAEPMEFAAWRRILAEKVDAYIQGESDGEGAGEDAYDDLKAHILAVPVAQPPAEQGAELPNVVATAPERIYLVIGEECPPDADFNDLERGMDTDDVTWCADQIDVNSIEYVRADRAARGGAA